jgi:hypothetical protein
MLSGVVAALCCCTAGYAAPRAGEVSHSYEAPTNIGSTMQFSIARELRDRITTMRRVGLLPYVYRMRCQYWRDIWKLVILSELADVVDGK